MTESTQYNNVTPVLAISKRRGKIISFRQQLFLIFAAFGLAVALTAALAYAYSTTQYIRSLYEQQAQQATQNFAELSELSLLYESGDNALDAAAATLSFPSIKFVSIINAEGKTLLEEGSWGGTKMKFIGKKPTLPTAELVGTTDTAWHFWAPVYTDTSEASDISEQLLEREYLGFVYVVQDQQEFLVAEYDIFRKNILIGMLGGLAFIILLHFLLNRLLAPMNRLVQVMDQTRLGDTTARAMCDGPEEIVDMAEIYNNVMDNLADRDARLIQQTEVLESEVTLRTQELVHARDQAIDASRHKSEFLANMSHELRTPLQAILGYTDIVKEGLEDEGFDEFSEDIERVTSNATHLLTLINSILDLSKIEAGRMDINLNPTNLERVISDTQGTIMPLIQQNKNELQIDINAPDTMFDIDRIKLLQIMLNLTSNAGKFTKNGVVSIRANISPEELIIEVADTGIGMNKDHLKMIFDPFRQVDGSATREFEGTGLGLSITRRFCEVMGGHIGVTSEVGKGSCFTVRFPLPIRVTHKQDETI